MLIIKWMLPHERKEVGVFGLNSEEIAADEVLRGAGILPFASWKFDAAKLPQAVAVLRFHGFEVEVEE